MAASQPRPSDSFVERFSVLVRGSQKRRVDLELRILDVAFASLFLLIALPLLGLISSALMLTSGRPLFYRGQRVGRDGRIFEMLKFRTLRRGAEERLGPYLGPELVERTQAETTRLGRRLRATQLDELPQLWNIVRGDMSFVGPRPIRPRFFEQLAAELPFLAGVELVDQLTLEREHSLRPAVEREPGLGRLDAAAGAVEQLAA